VVIDELIVILGLDARKFTEGQRDAMQAFKKGKEGALDFGKTVEESGARMADALGFARKGAMGLVGAFIGGEAAAFVGHVVAMDAATGRMAVTIGTSVPNLSLWQEMVRRVGGSAESATSALVTLQQEVENARQGSGMLEGGFASLLNQAGSSINDSPDVMLRKIQSFLSGQISSGNMRPEQAATFLRRVPGMNQDVLNLMLDNFKKIEEEARAMGGATKQSADEARGLQKETAALTNAFENLARITFPALTSIANAFTKAIQQDVKDVKGFLGFFHIGSGNVPSFFGSAQASTPSSDAQKRLADGMNNLFGGGGGGSPYRDAIGSVESGSSGGYKAIGPATGSGDRAYGKYQIMGSNIPAWSKEALGRSISIQEFMANPDLQDQIFDKKFGSYVAKYGADGAARAWLAGEGGMNDPSRRDSYGTNVTEYQRRFDKALGAKGAASGRGQGPQSSTSSSEVHIGEMHINAPNATDADGIASEAAGAFKRQAMIAPINNALV
jgi:hypothetical protein